jgi:hypothetical protein
MHFARALPFGRGYVACCLTFAEGGVPPRAPPAPSGALRFPAATWSGRVRPCLAPDVVAHCDAIAAPRSDRSLRHRASAYAAGGSIKQPPILLHTQGTIWLPGTEASFPVFGMAGRVPHHAPAPRPHQLVAVYPAGPDGPGASAVQVAPSAGESGSGITTLPHQLTRVQPAARRGSRSRPSHYLALDRLPTQGARPARP